MKLFTDLSLSPKVQKALEALGFTTLTEIQSKAIPLLLEDSQQDFHGQAQTGTGKTLAFGIPLIEAIDPSVKRVQGLVVAPTRELVLQIYESLRDVSRETGIAIEAVYGGMPIERQVQNIKRGAQIIIGTPGRLNDHLRRKTLTLGELKILVLDEADLMLDMGFREEVDTIMSHAPETCATWLFSATVRPSIQKLIKSHMKDVVSVKAMPVTGIATKQVKQYYCVVPRPKRFDALARFIGAAPDFYGIIFCQTKVLTNEVMERLVSRGFRANCLHGDMSQALRNQVIKGFKNKDFTILIATDVAARGIDVSGLSHVINFSLPDEVDAYVHRIGRTGRAGKEGIAIVFVSPAEVRHVKRLEKAAQTTLHEIPVPSKEAIVNAKLSAVSDFIEQSRQPNGEFSSTHKVLKDLVVSFSEEEIQNAFATALEEKFFKSLQEDVPGISVDSVGPKEICMELGRDAGVSEEEIRDYLHRTCSLVPQEISKVRVLNKKTFISIPKNRLSECLKSMQQSPMNDKRYKVYLVEDVPPQQRRAGGRKTGGPRGGGRSDSRGGRSSSYGGGKRRR